MTKESEAYLGDRRIEPHPAFPALRLDSSQFPLVNVEHLDSQRYHYRSTDHFVAYAVGHGKFFMLFKELQPVLTRSMLAQRAQYPGEPVTVFYMPPTMNDPFRRLNRYDPLFGKTYYDGSWNDGCDHADALAEIKVPAILIHATGVTTTAS